MPIVIAGGPKLDTEMDVFQHDSRGDIPGRRGGGHGKKHLAAREPRGYYKGNPWDRSREHDPLNRPTSFSLNSGRKARDMLAAVYHTNSDVRIREFPRPEPGEGEILIRIRASGICGSDLMEWYRVPEGSPGARSRDRWGKWLRSERE